MDQEEKFAANSIKFAPAGFAQKRSFANPNLGLSLSSIDFTDYSKRAEGRADARYDVTRVRQTSKTAFLKSNYSPFQCLKKF